MSKTVLMIEILGWTGTMLLLVAYALVSTRKVEGDSVPYQLMNIVGSILLIVNTGYHGAYPSAFLNVFWMAIAVFAIRRVFSRVFR